MNFNPNDVVDLDLLAACRAFYKTLPDIPTGDVRRLYLHWAVAPFGCVFEDYNFMIDLVDGQWVIKTTGDPRDNIPGMTDKPTHSHTWHRNSWALGIAIGGMDGATTSNFGKDPVELHELHYLCGAAAAVALKYNLQADQVIGDPKSSTPEHTIMTHAECAANDGYWGERWDLASFEPGPITISGARYHAELLRQRIHTIKTALVVKVA